MLIPNLSNFLWEVWITSSLLADSIGTMLILCIDIPIFVPSPARTFEDFPQQWDNSLNGKPKRNISFWKFRVTLKVDYLHCDPYTFWLWSDNMRQSYIWYILPFPEIPTKIHTLHKFGGNSKCWLHLTIPFHSIETCLANKLMHFH